MTRHETDPSPLALNTNEGAQNAISTYSTDRIILRSGTLMKLPK